jgi:hypothetical protein
MQIYDQWQKSPMQGVRPSPVDPLEEVEESLKSALPWLEQAYCLMNSNRLDKGYSDLYKGVCDALTACQDALDHIDDAPDQE